MLPLFFLCASPLLLHATAPNPTSLSATPSSITMPGTVRFCAGGGANMTVDLKYYWDGVLYETDYGVTFDATGCVDNYYDSDSFAGNYTFRWIRNSLNGPNGAWTSISTPVTLYPQPSPPTISYFYADQGTINIGQCTYLHWGSENATWADLSGEYVALTDGQQECPLSTTQYVLSVYDDSGQSARAFCTIRVNTQVNDAVYVDQTSLPAMEVGRTYPVYVTMRNTGTTTWSEKDSYRLGSKNPSNNTTWGLSRVYLAAGESVPPGTTKTFTFNVTAPTTPNLYYFQWQLIRDGVGWFGGQSPSTPASAVLPPTSMSFSPTQGNAGNDAYTVTVGGGANMSIGLKYEWSGNPGNVVTVAQWEHTLDSSGQAKNIKVNHNDAPGTYWYHAINVAGAPDWVNFSSPYPAFTILPPKPFANSLSISPSSIKPPASYTMTAGNTGGVKVDTRFMLNNGGPLYDTAFPTFNPAPNYPPGEPAEVTVNAATCTATGDYLFTGLRNTLLPTSDWSDQTQRNARIFVNCPDLPALDQGSPVVPGSVTAGASNSITIYGKSLCDPVTITSDTPGLTFSNPIPSDDYSGRSVTASLQVAATVAPGPYPFTLRTPCGQVPGTITVAPPSMPMIAIADTQGSPTDFAIQYGSLMVTQESPRKSSSYDVTLKNAGGQPLVISAIRLQHHLDHGWSDGAGVYSTPNLPALPLTLAYGQSLTFSARFEASFDLLSSASVDNLMYFSEILVESNDPNAVTRKVGLFATATANGIGDAPNGLILRANGEDLRGIYDLNTGADSTTYELVLLGVPTGHGTYVPYVGSQDFNADNILVNASGKNQMSLQDFVTAHGGSILGVSNAGGDTSIQFKMVPPKLPPNTSQGLIQFSFQAFLPVTLTVYDYAGMCDANILNLFNQLQACVVRQSGGLSGFLDNNTLVNNGRLNLVALYNLQTKSAEITNCLAQSLPQLHAILDLSRRLGNLSPGQIPEILTDAGDLIQFLPVPASVKKAINIAAQVAPLIETLLSHVSKAEKIIALARIGGVIDPSLAPLGPILTQIVFLYPCIFFSSEAFVVISEPDWFLGPPPDRIILDGIEVATNCGLVYGPIITINDRLPNIAGIIGGQIAGLVRDILAAVAPGGALDCDPVTLQCKGQGLLEGTNSLKALQISPTTLSFTAPYGGRSGASSFDVTNTALLCPRPSPDSLTYQIPVGNACGIPFFPLQQMTHHHCDVSGDETFTCPALGLSTIATNGLSAGDSLNFSYVFDLTDTTLLGGRPIQTIHEKVVFPGFGCVNLVGNIAVDQVALRGPGSLVRGETGSFTIVNADVNAQISGWRFSDGSNPPVYRDTNVTSKSWSGVMVTSGTVFVTVKQAGRTFDLQTDITVNSRNWHTDRPPAVQVPNHTIAGLDLPEPPQPSGEDAGLGKCFYTTGNPDSTDHTVIGDGGPNNGYFYFASPLAISGSFQYVINPQLENPDSDFSQHQCGVAGFISWIDLLTQTRRHEYNSETQSHYAVYSRNLNATANNPGDFFESRVGAPGSDPVRFNLDTQNGLIARYTQIKSQTKLVEPFGVNRSETGEFLGDINYANPTYTECPQQKR